MESKYAFLAENGCKSRQIPTFRYLGYFLLKITFFQSHFILKNHKKLPNRYCCVPNASIVKMCQAKEFHLMEIKEVLPNKFFRVRMSAIWQFEWVGQSEYQTFHLSLHVSSRNLHKILRSKGLFTMKWPIIQMMLRNIFLLSPHM